MYCSNCGKEIDNDSNFCPFCGADLKPQTHIQTSPDRNKNHNQKAKNSCLGCFISFIVFILMLFIATLIASVLFDDTIQTNDDTYEEAKKQSLEVINSGRCLLDTGTVAICGTIVNNTSKNYSYVQVEVNIYDSSGAIIDNAFDNMNNLEPGGKWKFKAPIYSNAGWVGSSYKVKNVTGF